MSVLEGLSSRRGLASLLESALIRCRMMMHRTVCFGCHDESGEAGLSDMGGRVPAVVEMSSGRICLFYNAEPRTQSGGFVLPRGRSCGTKVSPMLSPPKAVSDAVDDLNGVLENIMSEGAVLSIPGVTEESAEIVAEVGVQDGSPNEVCLILTARRPALFGRLSMTYGVGAVKSL